MASLTYSFITFSGLSWNASDFVWSKCNGGSGIGVKRVGFSVCAMARKVKKHEYPWPDNPDPDVKGGVLIHLSHFKPLKEKQKQVSLEFEKPLMELERKIIGIRKMAYETGLDFSDQILSLENKYQQALKDLYVHLTPIQRVNIARHPNRPTFLDHVLNITDKFVELHGDRAGYDDPAIVTGIGSIDGKRYMFIGHQKGRNTKENIQRNFGMPTPHGYRKALRMMYYADHHGFPIITFIDTPGAFADLKSEELGQGEAIAFNLRTMFGLKVPIVSIVIGEGGSGGALAIGCANKLLMLENAVFYVASPEACAAILWKSAKASPKAAEKLKITATELTKLQIADGIIPEPLGGAHADPAWTSQQIKVPVSKAMDELTKMDTQELLNHRMLKFRKLGGFQEGIPVDPIKKVNTKKKDDPIIRKEQLEAEIGNLRQKIMKAKESSAADSPVLAVNEMINKLKREVDQEFNKAVETTGLKDRLDTLHREYMKTKTSKNHIMHPGLMDKIEKLKADFNINLPKAPNSERLSNKLRMLNEISEAKKYSEQTEKAKALKQEINKRFEELLEQSDVKEKLELLNASSLSGGSDNVQHEKIVKAKREIKLELANVLRSLGLEVEVVESQAKDFTQHTSFLDINGKINELNKEITKGIENNMKSSDLKSELRLLKSEIAKAGNDDKVEALRQQIKDKLVEALGSSALVEKHEQLKSEIAAASYRGMDGNLNQNASQVGSF